MAKYISNPNPYAKVLDKKFTHQFFLLFAVVCGAAGAYYITTITSLSISLFGVGLIGVFVVLASKIFKQMGKNDRGENAEWQIKKILDELSDNYTVFQNVPIKSHLDVDFILVGPTGVLAIEVKSHKGFNMYLKDKFIGQTFAEMMGLKEYLKSSGVDIYIQAALVFTGAFVKYYPPKKGVHVINKEYLLKLIDRSKKIKFDQALVEAAISNLYSTKFEPSVRRK